MNFKPFFIHHNRNRLKYDSGRFKHSPRGFTAYVKSSGDREISVQVVFCSYKDNFVKSLGRHLVMKSPEQIINPRDLPDLVSLWCHQCRCDSALPSDHFYLYRYLM